MQVQEAEAGRLIEQTNLNGVETLYKLGYRSSGELAEARLNQLRAERMLATAISKRRELVEYEFKKKKMELEGAWPRPNAPTLRRFWTTKRAWLRPRRDCSAAASSWRRKKSCLTRYQDSVHQVQDLRPAGRDGCLLHGSSRYRREEIRAVRRCDRDRPS